MTSIRFLLIACIVLSLSGCRRDDARPADLPQLYSCILTITQEGKPVDEASVTLTSKNPGVKYAVCSGTTDATGKVVVRTYGYDGVPSGHYAVTVSKFNVEGQHEKINEYGETYMGGGKVYSYVEQTYGDLNTSSLEMLVGTKRCEATFDVGKAVRVYVSEAL